MLGELIGGRYRVERELGRGGFGAVYVALQADLGRRVALKLLHRRHLDGVGFERFQREARVAQQLSHPNTVRLFDFGVHDGLPFIAFELLNGESLASLLRNVGPLPPERVVRITSQILKSLMEAHDAGIVHRDIKPANVFICAYAGEEDFVKVLDFGIAKSVEDESAPLTNTGEAVGTPAYMSPEQLAGGVLSPATDLYAVGLLMAEMIAGTRILHGSGMDIALRQLDQQPLPFPEVVTRSPLWPLVARATRKLSSERFATAGAMLAALGAFAATSVAPVVAPGPASFAATRPVAYQANSVPATLSITPTAPSRRSLGGIVLVLGLLGGLGVLAVAGVAAAYFVDWGSLTGRASASSAADAGAASATSPDAATSSAAAAGSAPQAGGRAAVGTAAPTAAPTVSAPSTSTTTSNKGSTTIGSPCVSDKDCTGVYQQCATGGTCQCRDTHSFDKPRACGSVCVANNDSNNCGACGKRCANDEVCTTNNGGSVEHPICLACSKTGFGSVRLLCGAHVCVSPNTDPRNCGGCNIKCKPGQGCEGGVCK